MTTRTWLEIGVNGKRLGTLWLELYAERAPRTVENFRALCTGEKGTNERGEKLHLKGCVFHRLIRGFMIQGGDITKGDGTGGCSIYGRTFEDENYIHQGKHTARGVLSMANAGPDTNGSQFFILFDRASHLDGKHVVFGKVSSGFDVLDELEKLKTGAGNRPLSRVEILDCGEVDDENDESKRSENPADSASHAQDRVQQTMEKHGQNLRRAADALERASGSTSFPVPTMANPTAVYEDGAARLAAQERLDKASAAAAGAAGSQEYQGKLSARKRKLLELRQRKAQARSENSKEVLAEHERSAKQGASTSKEAARARWERTKADRKKQLELLGASEDKSYLLESLEKAERTQAGKQKKVDNILAAKAAHPLDNATIMRAYDKKLQRMLQTDRDSDDVGTSSGRSDQRGQLSLRDTELAYGTSTAVSDADKERMIKTFAEDEKPRKRLRNAQGTLEGEVATGINSMNEKVSRGLSKAYDKYTTELRQNLERGTAL
ncbi:Peptidyl-prolyl cis-trans isomerase [Hondaea fermentalgiana]|uniref:peptidylprolyl isomerase n=1 Tax=Hondaea fermentalgiana TaxID=2315210 RepID=A0A2R5GGQ7_9STRA|nr:Peptidyl-prolyl cis-trans isomerase [Hondaea fermentalgiana]|eukprot:GBG27843.1 Peptidyl-prolyl cis-trans isomerase [Hondaea fermentalgiana]